MRSFKACFIKAEERTAHFSAIEMQKSTVGAGVCKFLWKRNVILRNLKLKFTVNLSTVQFGIELAQPRFRDFWGKCEKSSNLLFKRKGLAVVA